MVDWLWCPVTPHRSTQLLFFRIFFLFLSRLSQITAIFVVGYIHGPVCLNPSKNQKRSWTLTHDSIKFSVKGLLKKSRFGADCSQVLFNKDSVISTHSPFFERCVHQSQASGEDVSDQSSQFHRRVTLTLSMIFGTLVTQIFNKFKPRRRLCPFLIIWEL